MKPTSNKALIYMKTYLPIFCILILSGCMTSNPSVVSEPETPQRVTLKDPKHFNDADRVLCDAAGGTYELAGLLGHFRCTRPYADGGEICSDNSDCIGKCIAHEDAEFNPWEKITGQTGMCQANNNPFGCHSDIVDGVVQPTLCVD